MNLTTEYSSLTNSTPEDSVHFHSLIFIASGITGCVTVVIHLWIVFSIALSQKLHSVSNVLLASLSFSEVLIGIVCIWSAYLVFDSHTEYPVLELELFSSCLHLVIVSYMTNSVAIAADRYFKVSRPMQYIRLVSIQKCTFVVAVIWCISVTFWIVAFTSLQITPNTTDTAFIQILLEEDSFATMTIYMMNVTLCPCITAVTCLTVSLMHIARRQQRKIKQEMLMLSHLRPNQLQQGQHLTNPPIGLNQFPRNPHRKTTIYFIVHFSAFVVAWIPNYVTMHIAYFGNPDVHSIVDVSMTFFMLALAQMLVGTMFLTFTQQEHRRVLRKAWQVVKLKCTCKWQWWAVTHSPLLHGEECPSKSPYFCCHIIEKRLSTIIILQYFCHWHF